MSDKSTSPVGDTGDEWRLSTPTVNHIIAADFKRERPVTCIDIPGHFACIVVFGDPKRAAQIVREHNAYRKLVEALEAVGFKADKGANGGLKIPGKSTSVGDCKTLMREIRDAVRAILAEVQP